MHLRIIQKIYNSKLKHEYIFKGIQLAEIKEQILPIIPMNQDYPQVN